MCVKLDTSIHLIERKVYSGEIHISYLNWPCSSFRSIVWNQTQDQNVLFWYMPYINVYMFWLLGHGIYSKCTSPGQCKAIDIVLLDNQQLSCLSQDITSNQVSYGPITVILFFLFNCRVSVTDMYSWIQKCTSFQNNIPY